MTEKRIEKLCTLCEFAHTHTEFQKCEFCSKVVCDDCIMNHYESRHLHPIERITKADFEELEEDDYCKQNLMMEGF